MRDPLIALGLRPGTAAADASGSPAGATQRLLNVLLEFIAEIDPIDTGTLVDRVEMYRLLAASEVDVQQLTAVTDACAAACRQVRERVEKQRQAQKTEIAALVALVHETLGTLAGSEQGFHSNFGESMNRMEELSRVDDVRQLKLQLAREIALVRQIAVARQKAWEETCVSLTDRVRTLEERLTETKRAATIDPLTQLTSRGAFDTTVNEWLASPSRPFVLALLDLDKLKAINDTYGHPAGDRAIVTVAAALKNSFRSVDVVARYGGDEFALLARDVGFQQVEKRLRMLATSLQSSPIELPDGQSMRVTVSCGMAEYSAGDTLASLIERADTALYDAKRAGRDRIMSKQKPTLRSLMQH
jgi:diguanylate cyclase (GGDEF)-like protein